MATPSNKFGLLPIIKQKVALFSSTPKHLAFDKGQGFNFLTKPVKPEKLHAFLSQLVRKKTRLS